MGSSSIDISVTNIWRSWYQFCRGKNRTYEFEEFSYYLERNLRSLWTDLDNDSYKHGPYRKFIVTDNKRRQISIASIRDRVVHRLMYEYLVEIYDKTFIFDAWSCRKGKGLIGAIERTQKFLGKYKSSFIWRADIRKFFDNVDHNILLAILSLRITDKQALNLLKEIIGSYSVQAVTRERERERE